MPSIQHEAVVEILHRDPQLAAMLLGRAGVSLPSGATPVMADSNLSVRDPSMLSIICGDLDLTSHEARMFALRSIADAPAELRPGYTRLIHALVPNSAWESLEELMKTVLKDDFVDGLLDQGRAEGEARIVLRILTARGLPVTDEVRDRVTGCADTSQLEAWADRAITATVIEDVFGADETRA